MSTNKIEVKPVQGSYGTVKWLFAEKLTIRLMACWNEFSPEPHAELSRNGASIAVGFYDDSFHMSDELSSEYHMLTPNAQSHVRQALKRALESEDAVDSDEVCFTLVQSQSLAS